MAVVVDSVELTSTLSNGRIGLPFEHGRYAFTRAEPSDRFHSSPSFSVIG
jgi:hypothetical protein